MSRTDKDRPYWVIQNDRTLGRIEEHDHRFKDRCTRFGGKYGKPEFEEYGEYVWIQRYSGETSGLTADEYLEYSQRRMRYVRTITPGWETWWPRSGGLKWFYERRVRLVREVIKEPTWVEPLAECTVDEPNRPWRLNKDKPWLPCETTVPDRDVWGKYYGPKTDERIKDNRRRRRSASTNLKSLAGEYNLHGEVDDSAWFDYAPPHAPFKGGWWD